jgi:peptidyl-tRNA hydrolase
LVFFITNKDLEEEFEDTKGAIRIRISKKNRQHNGQKKMYQRTNNDFILETCWKILEKEFEDTKGAIRIRISKKNRQHNGQKKMYQRTNNNFILETCRKRVWRYQRGNQNPYIEEEQTTQWPKEKVQKDKQRLHFRNLYLFVLMKESLNSDGQKFNQYQQSKQRDLLSNHWTHKTRSHMSVYIILSYMCMPVWWKRDFYNRNIVILWKMKWPMSS